MSQWEISASQPLVKISTSSAWSLLITPAAKTFLRGPKKIKSEGSSSGLCGKGCNTSHPHCSNHWSPGLCGCHIVMEDDDIKTELSQPLSLNSLS
jgi:hypothetical protein